MNRLRDSLRQIATLAIAGMLCALSPPSVAALYTVNAADDVNDGACNLAHCSLREAITAANAAVGPHTIGFAIVGNLPQVILPTSALPTLTRDDVTVDGYTQPGSMPNGHAQISNALIGIELDGAASGGSAAGLRLNGDRIVLRGLAIQGFETDNVTVSGVDVRVAGCFLGTDASGRNVPGGSDTDNNVQIAGTGAGTVGGPLPADRNVIGGARYGVRLAANSGPTLVAGNLIGLSRDAALGLGQSFVAIISVGGDDAEIRNNVIADSTSEALFAGQAANGLLVSGNRFGVDPLGDGTTIGWLPFGNGQGNGRSGFDIRQGTTNMVVESNVVAFSANRGFFIIEAATQGIDLRGNSVFGSAQLGIDLGGDGVSANDAADPDGGPNGTQNFPVLSSAIESTGAWMISGALNSLPTRNYRIELFGTDECNASGHGEGNWLLDTHSVATDVGGNAGIARNVSGGASGPVRIAFVTATATDTTTGGTSEFSPCIAVAGSANAGFVRLGQRLYTATEFAAPAAIVVERFGGSVGAASVRLRAEPGSATVGEDFDPLDTLLTWADGEQGPVTVGFAAIGDILIEAEETANLRLANPVGVRFGSRSGAFVRLVQSLPSEIFEDGFEN